MRFIEILNGIDMNWSIKEKARYVYTNLCKNVSYDEKFSYSQDKKLLEDIYYKNINIENEEDTKVVCRTLNLIYQQLLKRLEIKSSVIYKKTSVERLIDVEDTALIFWDEEGNKYYTNIIGDIENCKFGVKTAFFGTTKNLYEEAQDVKEISQEELKKIDLKTGYIKIDYNDIVFKLLTNEIKNTNNFKKFLKSQGIDADNLSSDEILKNKLQYINRLIKFRDRTAGPDEQKKFYKKLFCASTLDKFESKKFKAYEYIKEDNEKIEILSILKINISNMPIYYIYSDEEQTYIQISQEQVIEKIKGYRERKGKNILEEQEIERN